MIPPIKFEVKPTSITGHSLLVLPDPGHHTPKLSLQMETEQAKRLAHAANVLPGLVVAMKSLLKLWEGHSSKECDEPQCAVCFANKELASAENVETKP